MDVFKKFAAFGLGLVDLTEEKARELAREIIERGEAKQEEYEGLSKDLLERTRAWGDSLRQMVDRQVDQTLKGLQVVRQEDLEKLEARIAELEAKLGDKEQAES